MLTMIAHPLPFKVTCCLKAI